MERIICLKSKKQDAAVQRITLTLMRTVTMKLQAKTIGVNVNRMGITWLASTEGDAMIFTAL